MKKLTALILLLPYSVPAFAGPFTVYTSARIHTFESGLAEKQKVQKAVGHFMGSYVASTSSDISSTRKAKRFFDRSPSSPAFVRWQQSSPY